MKSINECLVLICNPKLPYDKGAGIGSILAAKFHAEKNGAVYWDVVNRVTRKHLKAAYLYDTSKKLITHRADIKIFDSEDVPIKDKKYYPHFRKEYFHTNGWTSIKMRNIKALVRPVKAKTMQVNISRGNFRYGYDTKPKIKSSKSSFESISDEYIFNCLINRKFLEKDIKEMLFTLGLFNSKVIDTEKLPNDRRFDRYDILYRNSKGRPFLVEIKKDIADKNTLLQLKRYMKSLKKTEKRGISGIILCKDATPELEKLAKKENIKIQRFRFSIDFGNLMDD